ncbi:MAG: response regulator, partial [Gammaproteobacteria bacterium]
RIYHIGLEKREILVIRSLFRLAPQLNDRFVFGEPTDDDAADILFVNGDDTKSLKELDALRKKRVELIPILVVSHDREIPDLRTIKKPLAFKKFMEILDLITSAESEVKINSDTGGARHARILVVDDSFPARQYMKFKLEELSRDSMSLTVDFADTGESGIASVEANDYDLIFLDVVLPSMDGYEVCRRMRQLARTPIVMLTGQKAAIDKMRAKLAGCDEYLTKPPPDSDLKRIFENLVNTLQASVA